MWQWKASPVDNVLEHCMAELLSRIALALTIAMEMKQ